jgi:predicted CXXCH cytochrome family protein
LQAAEPALCAACHRPAEPKTLAAHKGFPIAGARCTGCHAPHASPRAALVRANVHVPFGEGECASCHESRRPAIAPAARAALCVTCHEPRQGGHPVPEPPGCTGCHAPHASSGPALAAGRDRAVCLQCHRDVAGQRAGAVSLHPAAGGTQDCTACHAVHTGQTASLLAKKDAQATCMACHASHTQFSHPMGEGVADPSRPGRSVGCLSCHDPHGTTYPGLLLADPRQDLCRRCHADGGD